MLTNSRRRLGDFLPVIAAAYMTLPEVWTKPLRIGQVSVLNVLFMLILVASCKGILKRTNGVWIGAAMAALVFMAVVGIANTGSDFFDWKVYLADMLTFCGLIAGMSWARQNSIEQLGWTARMIAIATAACLALDYVCLYSGIVKPSWDGPRMFVFSMFFGTWWLMVVSPLILATEGLEDGLLSRKFSRILLAGIAMLVIWVAITSGTRSVALDLIACVFVCLPLILRNFRTAYATVIVAVVMAVTAYAMVPKLNDFQFFADRLADTDLGNEERYAEVQMMMDQLMPRITEGAGFGASFISPVIVEGRNLAVAPHVGILTLLFKGGFVIFSFVIVVPLAMALFFMVVNRDRPYSYGCMAGVILYAFAGSLSGGWGFLHLFLAGLMFSAGLTLAKTPIRAINAVDPNVVLRILTRLNAHESAAVPQVPNR